ncbi:MAG TPA: ATP-binding protein, partial [Pseudonocardiaceae bacterium]|nr:ATP-binding protein [Pseudonocardiaceae bacterium]
MTDCLDQIEGAPGQPGPPECPYPGTGPFSEDQKRYFFGRDQDTQYLLDRLRQRQQYRGGGPVVLAAASGTGKSSLLAAGLIPALGRTPGFAALKTILATPEP